MAAFFRGGCSRNPLPWSSGGSCSSGLSPSNCRYPPSGSSETRYSVSPHWNPKSLGPNPIEKRTALTPSHLPTTRCPSSWKNTMTLMRTAKETSVRPAECIQETIAPSVMCMTGISSTASVKVGEDACTQEDKRGGEEEGVDAVQHAAMPRQEAAGILGSERALEHRLAEIANRPQHARSRTYDHTSPPGQTGQPAEGLHGQRTADRGQEPAGGAFPGLARGDARVELALPVGAPREVRAGVVQPGHRQGEDKPGESVRQLAQPHHGAEQEAGIDRPQHRKADPLRRAREIGLEQQRVGEGDHHQRGEEAARGDPADVQ